MPRKPKGYDRPGRPEHEVTERSRAIVQVMYAHGIPQHIIAQAIGCAPNTLNKHYKDDLRDATLKVEAAMGAVIVQAARNGSWGAAKYWLMTHGNPQWKVTERHEIGGFDGASPITVSEESKVVIYLPDNGRDKPVDE